MYDQNKQIRIQIPNPTKSATVRLPTSAELTYYINAYAKRRKKQDDDRTLDVELFRKIRLEEGDEFDEYEASFVLNRLISTNVISCEKEDSEYHVRISTPFGETLHVLQIPTYKQMATWRSSGNNGISSAIKFYDGLVVRTEGYADSANVPVHHKQVAVIEVQVAVSQIDPILIDPN